jgi:ATP-dependent Zn protease
MQKKVLIVLENDTKLANNSPKNPHTVQRTHKKNDNNLIISSLLQIIKLLKLFSSSFFFFNKQIIKKIKNYLNSMRLMKCEHVTRRVYQSFEMKTGKIVTFSSNHKRDNISTLQKLIDRFSVSFTSL